MKTVRITRDTMINQKPVSAGEILDVDDGIYKILVDCNKCEDYKEPLSAKAQKTIDNQVLKEKLERAEIELEQARAVVARADQDLPKLTKKELLEQARALVARADQDLPKPTEKELLEQAKKVIEKSGGVVTLKNN